MVISQETSILLIVPAYNEESRLDSLSYFTSLSSIPNLRLCFVDDGSTDKTPEILRRISESTNSFFLQLPQNFGKAEAIRQGLLFVKTFSNPNFVGFLDCDGAFPVHSVEVFLQESIKKFHLEPNLSGIIASRVMLSGRAINRSSSRHYVSRILLTLVGLFVENLPYDSQSGLKLFRSTEEFWISLKEHFRTRWFFDVELLIRNGFLKERKLWEEPVTSWNDVAGSHLRYRNFLRILLEIAKIALISK